MEQTHTIEKKLKNQQYLLAANIIILALIGSGVFLWLTVPSFKNFLEGKPPVADVSTLTNEITPASGVELPVQWGNMGKKLVENSIIDKTAFDALYAERGGMSDADKQLAYGTENKNIVITQKNSGLILNLLWGFGLANKSDVLDKGPMRDPKYGGAGRFAATGGWTLGKGDPVAHYSKHALVKLTAEQEKLVEAVTKNIYRPCCGNSTYFPDCNHGMAMLGLMELMASQGATEDQMYKTALIVNSYWFPDTYLTIGKYMESLGTPWKNVSPKEILGFDYSSAQGYAQIQKKIEPVQGSSGSSCGA